MNKTIKNTIVFTNGDSIVINESITLPLKEKVMYKIKNSEKNAIIVTSNGETFIPINNNCRLPNYLNMKVNNLITLSEKVIARV